MRKAMVSVVGVVVALGLVAPGAGAHGKVPRLILFQSPSHNIGCAMDRTSVRCDVAEHDWVAPPKPKRCDLDWGNGLAVARGGKASFVCAGDTTLHQGHVLAYGKSKHLGNIGCTSLLSGVRCVNHETGHGFLLSRTRAHRF